MISCGCDCRALPQKEPQNGGVPMERRDLDLRDGGERVLFKRTGVSKKMG